MSLELERATVDLVRKIYGGPEQPTPDWLQRPAAAEAGCCWEFVRAMYAELTDMELPDVMPPRERRKVDCVLQRRGEPPRLTFFCCGVMAGLLANRRESPSSMAAAKASSR